MLSWIRERLTYANVTATVAVFIALGGASYAAFHLPKDSVKSKNIVDGQVKQADVSHTLTVSGATNATHATSADTATNAAKLGGQGASAYALAGAEAVQLAALNDGSAGGNPPNTSCSWNYYGGGQNQPGYYRDRAGVVHLQGLVFAQDGTSTNCGGNPTVDYTITMLPAGYRPANKNAFPTISNNAAPGRINVLTDGTVSIETNFPTWANAKASVSLDGISFRCSPSGQDGCP